MAQSKSNSLTINISHKTIFFSVFVVLLLMFLNQIRGILIGLFVSFLVVIAINPLVNWLEKRRIPRVVSSLFVILVIFVFIITSVASAVSPLINQTQILISRLPNLIASIAPYYEFDLAAIAPTIGPSVPGDFIKLALDTFSGIIVFATFLFIIFYLLLDRPHWNSYLELLFGAKADRYKIILYQLEVKLGAWVRGMISLMIIVGVLNYTGFVLIGLPYALPLALIAGILEIIPNIGPNIAGVLAAIVGFSISPTHGLLALLVAIIAQQLENNLLVPKIMQKAIGIHPVITIVALLIGLSVGGFVLAILSLPLILVFQVALTHIHYNKKTHNTSIN